MYIDYLWLGTVKPKQTRGKLFEPCGFFGDEKINPVFVDVFGQHSVMFQLFVCVFGCPI
jgi:hypothetical protein